MLRVLSLLLLATSSHAGMRYGNYITNGTQQQEGHFNVSSGTIRGSLTTSTFTATGPAVFNSQISGTGFSHFGNGVSSTTMFRSLVWDNLTNSLVSTDVTGHTSTAYKAGICDANANAYEFWLAKNGGTNNAVKMAFFKSMDNSVNPSDCNANTIMSANGEIGWLEFYGSDSGSYRLSSIIKTSVDGTPGASNMPGRISLWTSNQGTNVPVKRFHVDSYGVVGMGTGVNISSFTESGWLKMNAGSSVTLSGSTGFISLGSSVTTTGGLFGTTALISDQSLVRGTETVAGNAFSVGTSTFIVREGTTTINGELSVNNAQSIFRGVVYASGTVVIGTSTVDYARFDQTGNLRFLNAAQYRVPTQWAAFVADAAPAAGLWFKANSFGGFQFTTTTGAKIVGFKTTGDVNLGLDGKVSTQTANGYFVPARYTLATIRGMTPGTDDVFGIVICSDCASAGSVCQSTGTTIGGFRLGTTGTTECK